VKVGVVNPPLDGEKTESAREIDWRPPPNVGSSVRRMSVVAPDTGVVSVVNAGSDRSGRLSSEERVVTIRLEVSG